MTNGVFYCTLLIAICDRQSQDYPMPEVKVQFNNGDEKTLFEFYPDEISFKESEFIGLTEESARRLKFEKDKRYIQS